MGSSWREHIVLYWGQQVLVTQLDGTCLEGRLEPDGGDQAVSLGGGGEPRRLPYDEVGDLRMIGRTKGGASAKGWCRLYGIGACRGDYQFSLEAAGKDIRESLRYGEFECEIDCHLEMDEASGGLQALDVRLRRRWHSIFPDRMEGQVFLYRLRDQRGYFPAVLTQGGEGPALERLDGGSIPLRPEEIADITRCPKAGDIRVWVRLLDGTEHEGTVSASLDEFFTLGLGKDGPRIPYGEVEQLRFYGQLIDGRYNKKYCPLPDPDGAPLPPAARYTIGVGGDRLLAKDCRPVDACRPAAAQEDGAALGLLFGSPGGSAFICTAYAGARTRGEVWVHPDLLPDGADVSRSVYVVRYAAGEKDPGHSAPPALWAELSEAHEPYARGEYKKVWIDEKGEVQAEKRPADQQTYDPRYLLGEAPRNCELRVSTADECAYGRLLGADADTVRLAVDGGERSFPMDRLTEVRGFGEVSKWYDHRGFGFIRSDVGDPSGLYFHIGESNRAYEGLLEAGRRVSFRLMPDEKGRPRAHDALPLEEQEETRQIFVDGGGRCRLMGTRLLFDEGEGPATLLNPPAEPRPAVYKAALRSYRGAGTGRVECQWVEGGWGRPQPLEFLRLEDLDWAPRRPGAEYRYGLACLERLSERYQLPITGAWVNGDWNEERSRGERDWGRSVFWDAKALKANEEYRNRLLLIRYVLSAQKEDNPIKREAPPVSVVDAGEPPVVLWCSEDGAKSYQFAALQGGQLVYSRMDTADAVEDTSFFDKARELAETAGESDDVLRKRLSLQKDLGDQFFKRGGKRTAGKYYRDWRSTHRLLCRKYPEQKSLYDSWHTYVTKQLAECGEDHSVYAEAEVRRLMDAADPAALGKEKLEALEKALRSRNFSVAQTLLNTASMEKEKEECPRQVCWAMARYCQELWERAANPAVTRRRDQWLARALLAEAGEEPAAERKTYLCHLAVRIEPGTAAFSAAYLAAALLPPDAPSGAASIRQVLEAAQKALGEELPESFILDSLSLFSALRLLPQHRGTIVRELERTPRLSQGYRKLLSRYLAPGGGPGALQELVDRASQSFSDLKRELFAAAEGGDREGVRSRLEQLLRRLGREDFLEKEEGRALEGFLALMESISPSEPLARRMDAFELCLREHAQCADRLSQRPACLVSEVILPLLEESGAFLKQGYRELCVTTVPGLTVDKAGQMLSGGLDASGRLKVRVDVRVEGGFRQTAEEPRLWVRKSGDFTLEEGGGPILPLAEMSAGEMDKTVGFEFWVTPTDPKSEDVTLQVQLKYSYRNGEPDSTGKYGCKAEGIVPASEEYQTVTVSIESQERARISKRNLNQFSLQGVRIEALEKDEGLRRILDNRAGEVRDICRNLDKKWIILQGQWRVGKTTVLNLVANQMDPETCCVVSLEPPNPQRGRDYDEVFAGLLFDRLKEKAAVQNSARWREGYRWLEGRAAPADLEGLGRTLNGLMKELGGQAEILFLVDEFTNLYSLLRRGAVDGGFLRRWAGFALNLSQAAVITAGGEFTRDMAALFAPNEYQKAYVQNLEYLSREDVERFLRYVVRDEAYFKPSMDRPVMDKLYRLTQGNVYLLVRLCEIIIDYINEDIDDQTTPNVRCYITEGLIMEAVEEYAGKNYDFNQWFDFLSNPYRVGSDRDGVSPVRKHLDDDEVREDNETILKTFADLANPDTASCLRSRLLNKLCGERGEEDRARWEKRLDALAARKVINRLEGSDPAVKVKIELLYAMERAQKLKER